ncbi:MAG: TetR family transcriptional regulator [Calditrichia bacterium]
MAASSKTEQKIIEAATAVFLQKGKQGARMQEIADRAGINKALLHYYFRSKDQLYQQVFNHQVRQIMLDIFQSMPLHQNFREYLQFFIEEYISRLHRSPQIVRFMLWEIDNEADNLKTALSELFRSPAQAPPREFILRIQQAVEKREIRPLDPYHLLFNILGMCLYVFTARPILQAIFPEVETTSEAFVQKRKQEIFELVWRGIRTTEV